MLSTTLPAPPLSSTLASGRIPAIDALRGLVMLLMLVDHAREFFFIHAQVSDPMALQTTAPALFFTRLSAHLCAPVFVILTGLSAWLYGAKSNGAPAASGFLFKRGLFLIVLELTLVNFAWTFSLTPSILYLQVIWAIGLSMVALSALVYLPRPLLLAVGLTIMLGHNLLDPITVAQGQPGHAIWAILHDRGFIDLPGGGQARTSYPVLPWIGVAALGYALGPWFAATMKDRNRRLVLLGLALLALFGVLRAVNLYGDPTPWTPQATPLGTAMSMLNLQKYPPSADFLLLTLGVGILLLAALERAPPRLTNALAVYGGAPLFFYLLHLYGLHLLYLAAFSIYGPNHGGGFGLPGIGAVWLLAAAVALPCWPACRAFSRLKRRSRQPWMKYL